MTAPSKNNIYLIGLMGSGKTTIGRLLARRMGRVFFDSDHEIEHRTGVRIPVIFELEGEAGFRRREAQTIAELGAEGAGVVLATGGGVVLDPANREVLRNTGWVVYLDVPTHILFERTRHDANRPLLRVEDPLAKLNELRAQRDPLYRETAHFIVDGARCNSNGAVNRILQAWERQCAQSR